MDGTDDAQIIVTVVDKDGRAISNCPPVTLAVESGPGEFPTGPSITFAPDSDITIRDGQAAMEFRSYYAGKTAIRATSPGLKDATIRNHLARGAEIHRRQNARSETAPLCAFHGKLKCNSSLIDLWPGKSDTRQQRSGRPQRTFRQRRQCRHLLAG